MCREDPPMSPAEKLKAAQDEQKAMEQVLVKLRLEFDEYRRNAEAEKVKLEEEKEQYNSTIKELLVKQANLQQQGAASSTSEADPMFQKNKAIVQGTWKAVKESLNVEATKLFYKHLFEKHPEVIPMFKGNMDGQAQSLFNTVSTAVDFLDNVDELIPVLQELGAKVRRSYYFTGALLYELYYSPHSENLLSVSP